MIEELTITAKQTGLELIDMSDKIADRMRTWADLFAEDQDIQIATFTAGFISDPAETHNLQLTMTYKLRQIRCLFCALGPSKQ